MRGSLRCVRFPIAAAMAASWLGGALAHAATVVYVSAATDKQIIVLQMDETSGALRELQRVSLEGEPAALITSPDRRFLFASHRSTGKLQSFRLDRDTGRLTPLRVVEAGADPAHIHTDRTGRYLFTAYYVAAKVSVHAIGEDGSLGERPVQEIATAEKAHAAVPDAGNRFVFVPHTGPNAIFQFAWDAKAGRLSPLDPAKLTRPKNTGPRHLAWHPTKSIAYIDNEQGGSVTAYRMDDKRGTLTPGDTVSTLPGDFRGENACAELKVHPTGRFLYVANRGHDSLAIFRIGDDGAALTAAGHAKTEKTPRSFDIDPRGKFAIAAGESSGHLAVSQIDERTGELTPRHRLKLGDRLWWVLIVPLPH
jgi:6-phosphogluconolactonase